jgi:hypothetical protein
MKQLILGFVLLMAGVSAHAGNNGYMTDYSNIDGNMVMAVDFIAQTLSMDVAEVKATFAYNYNYKNSYEVQTLDATFISDKYFCHVTVSDGVGGNCEENN